MVIRVLRSLDTFMSTQKLFGKFLIKTQNVYPKDLNFESASQGQAQSRYKLRWTRYTSFRSPVLATFTVL
jgi:hypothetical protein